MANITTSRKRAYREVKPPVGSSVNWSHPLSKGLVGCWLMNEGGGRKLVDLVGGTHGAIQSGKWMAGKDGACFDFSTTTNRIDFGDTKIFDGLIKATWSFWIYPNASWSGGRIITKWGSSYGSAQTFLISSSASVANSIQFAATDGTGTRYLIKYTSSGLTVAKWTHVTVVWYGNLTVKIFFDGIEKALTDTSSGSGSIVGLPDRSAQLQFGYESDESTASVNMKLSDVVFWGNRVLSPSEIKSLYESPYQFIAPARKIRYIIGVGGEASQNATITASAIVSRFFAPAVTVTATSASQSATITATAIKASFVAPAITAEATKNATVTATAIPVSIVAPSVSVSTGGNASISVSAIKASFVANPVTVEATRNAVAVATAAAVRFLANSVTVSTTINTAVSVTSVLVKFVAGVATVQAIRNVTIDATSAYAQFLVNSATIVIGGVDSGITEVILLSSLVSKRLHEKSRISKRLNEVSRIDKTLLLGSPIH